MWFSSVALYTGISPRTSSKIYEGRESRARRSSTRSDRCVLAFVLDLRLEELLIERDLLRIEHGFEHGRQRIAGVQQDSALLDAKAEDRFGAFHRQELADGIGFVRGEFFCDGSFFEADDDKLSVHFSDFR